MKNINHLCYHIDVETLIRAYVAIAHSRDTVIAIHNPVEYSDFLSGLGLHFNKNEIHFDKVLLVHVADIDDGLHLIGTCDPTIGPICSLWSGGKRVTDNIEENLTTCS